MQQIGTLLAYQPKRGGGRIASPDYRHSRAQSDDFRGLERNTNRYDLLLLVKRVGKLAGFTPRMIHLLDYYLAFTRDIDWEEGSRPIVYQSLTNTALDLGVAECQIQRLEKRLFEAGAITWNDSGNHKRFGSRHPDTGRIQFAYGIDLTPLAYLRGTLEEKLHEKMLYDQAWRTTKRQISELRRQIRSTLLEIQEEGAGIASELISIENAYESMAVQLRSHIPLEAMRTLLSRHQSLYSRVLGLVAPDSREIAKPTLRRNFAKRTHKRICTSRKNEVHIHSSNQININSNPADTCFQKSVVELPEPADPGLATGVQHVTLKQVLLASSERFRARLPLEPRPMNWQDVVEAAYRLRPDMHISQRSWGEACQVLGRVGASLCLLITDAALDRGKNAVRQPAAYFQGMVNRARAGELHLHNSVFGLIEQGNFSPTCSPD